VVPSMAFCNYEEIIVAKLGKFFCNFVRFYYAYPLAVFLRNQQIFVVHVPSNQQQLCFRVASDSPHSHLHGDNQKNLSEILQDVYEAGLVRIPDYSDSISGSIRTIKPDTSGHLVMYFDFT
jgi:hypothetical protein